ncbi:hypothetical protein HHI36_010723 [Cryptolaemus montrouzieri]|uniref:F-box/LRR-repeat protein 15-like leucin rich repeat domain-containing protein n=1 Tax=Cryptolaemus montrouzieri TaxID=559131 RepID=A0ABD2MJH9_9CUCU
MSNEWKKPIPSLFTLSLDYVVDNLHVFSKDCDCLNYLPSGIKDKLLKRLTISSYFWKKLDFKKTFHSVVHAEVKKIDLTSVYVDDELLRVLEICKGLETVHLLRIGTHNISKTGIMSFLKCLSQLQFLQVRNCDVVDDTVLECISENCRKLSALDIGGCTKVSDNGINCLKKIKGIRCLTLSKTQITNDGLINFIQGANGAILRELKIDNCKNISEQGLLAITKYCPNLEILIFFNCSTGRDGTTFILEESNLKNLRQLTWTFSW